MFTWVEFKVFIKILEHLDQSLYAIHYFGLTTKIVCFIPWANIFRSILYHSLFFSLEAKILKSYMDLSCLDGNREKKKIKNSAGFYINQKNFKRYVHQSTIQIFHKNC